MTNILTTLLNNKHTSISGLVYLVAKFGTQLCAVWWPDHKDKLDSTANLIEGAAVAYGLLSAGDASKSATKKEVAEAIQSGDTSHLTKADVPAQPPKT